MKITEIIVEGSSLDAKRAQNLKDVFSNQRANISRTSKEAKANYDTASKNKNAGYENPEEMLAKVAALYGVEVVDDFTDVLELPNGKESTDKAMSMFSKDNR